MDCKKCGLTLTEVDTEVYECDNVDCEDYLVEESRLNNPIKYVLAGIGILAMGESGILAIAGLLINNPEMSIVSIGLSMVCFAIFYEGDKNDKIPL